MTRRHPSTDARLAAIGRFGGHRSVAYAMMSIALAVVACGGAGGSGVSPTTVPIPTTAASATYTITWQAVTDPSVAGYRVYFSSQSLTGATQVGFIDVPQPMTSVDLAPSSYLLNSGDTLHVAVSSTDVDGNESSLSSEQTVVVK
jgi:hypothetical protein